MEYDHNTGYFYKKSSETFDITQKFNNDLASGESLSSATASAIDSSGVDKTSALIDSVSNTATNVSVVVKNGTPGETYQIKVTGTSSASEIFIYYITCEVFGEITINTKLGDSGANSYVTLKEANDYIRNKYGHPNKWDSLSVEGRKRLLIEAAKTIDRFTFTDSKYYDSQNRAFPRSTHDIITGNCATPLTIKSFKNANLTSDTYGKYPTNYWETSAVHITEATPLYDVRVIASSNVSGVVEMTEDFSATPTANTVFILFAPLANDIKHAQCEQALFLIDNPGDSTLQTYMSLGAREVSIGDVRVMFGRGGSSSTTSNSVSPVTRKLLNKWIRKTFTLGRA